MKGHKCKHARISWVSAAAVLMLWLALPALSSGEESPGKETEFSVEKLPLYIERAPDTGLVAFGLLGSVYQPSCTWIVDAGGRVVWRSDATADPVQHDLPMGWSPCGKALLVQRSTMALAECGVGQRQLVVHMLASGEGTDVVFDSPRPESGRLADLRTIVYRVDEGSADVPGLWIAIQEPGGAWLSRPLLNDTKEVEWAWDLSVHRDGGVVQLVAEGLEPEDGAGQRRSALWLVEVLQDGACARRQLTPFDDAIMRWSTPADSSLLTVLRDEGEGQRSVLTLDLVTGAQRAIEAPDDVFFISSSTDGSRALLWDIGSTGPGGSAKLFVSADAGEWRRVDLPQSIAAITDVEWLSDDAVLIGVPDYGLIRLSLSDGTSTDFWVLSP